MKIKFKFLNPIEDFKTFQSGKDVFQTQAHEVNRVYFSVLKKVAEPEEFETGFNETVAKVEKLAKGGLGTLIENAYVTLEKLKTEVSEEELRVWQYATAYMDFLLKFDDFIGKHIQLEKKLQDELYIETINIALNALEHFAMLEAFMRENN